MGDGEDCEPVDCAAPAAASDFAGPVAASEEETAQNPVKSMSFPGMYQSERLEGDGGACEQGETFRTDVASAAPSPASVEQEAALEEETPSHLVNSDEEESEAEVTFACSWLPVSRLLIIQATRMRRTGFSIGWPQSICCHRRSQAWCRTSKRKGSGLEQPLP